MQYSTISANAIVGRTLSSFGIKNQSITYEALEWIADGIAEIGYGVGLIDKWQKVEVVNNKIDKPSDFFSLNYIIYNGQKLKYGSKPSNYQSGNPIQVNPQYTELIQLINARYNALEWADGESDHEGCIDCLEGDYKLLDSNELDRIDLRIKEGLKDLKHKLYTSNTEYFLDTEGDCYNTSIESGYVVMYYEAFPTDKEGYPLVIDEMKYKMALEYVVMERLMRGGYQHPVLPYQLVAQDKDRWIAKARNEHNKFTDGQMQDFLSNWTNMLFQVQKSNSYFSNG